MNIIKIFSAVFLSFLLSSSCLGRNTYSKHSIPEEVRHFQENRDLCDHLRGEDSYDEERQKFLIEQIKKYCTGTDYKLKKLKLKYKNDKDIYKVLNQYEENIE